MIDTACVFIPPLLLQPFVENAIWHGLMHKQAKGCLEIALSIDEKILTCIITDDGIGRGKAALINSKSAEKNKSMGVQITIDRLALLSRTENGQARFNIEDLTDGEGNAAGTKVTLKMKYRNLAEA
jgi:sensor histidine kinase YesM